MTQVVSFVGRSDSGKTTLMEKVIKVLCDKGYRIGTIKHYSHEFSIDHEGKDSWKHARAGAISCAVSGPEMLALTRIVGKQMAIDDIVPLMGDLDLVMTEGYKHSDKPKIEVFKSNPFQGLVCSRNDNLIAVVGDRKIDAGVPWFHRDDIQSVVGFLESKFLR